MPTPATNAPRLFATLAATSVTLAAPALAQERVAWIEIEGSIADRTDQSPAFMFEPEAPPSMRAYTETFERIADGAIDVDGVVLRLREPMLSVTGVEELGVAIGRASESGVPIHVFSEHYGPTELVLASFADEVIVQTGGTVSLPGLYAEEWYMGDTLAWAGVEGEFVQIGDYKGAVEAIVNDEPSEAWDENIAALLDGLYESVRRPIKEGRELSDFELDRAMREAVFADGGTASDVGLIDYEMDRLELDRHIEEHYGEDFVWSEDILVDAGAGAPDFENMGLFEFFGAMQRIMNEGVRREPTGPTVAVVHISGAIVDGESSSGGFSGEGNTGALTIRKTLARLAENDHVGAVVLRIDSPGGSASASEAIWLGLEDLREREVPVIASVGTMAASGGYYVAVGADEIYVNPSSIVGSIGVVGGKFILGGMYDKLRINAVPRTRGPMGGVLRNATRPWNDAERALIRERMEEVYELFTERVEAGRAGIDLSRTAEGRLFVGRDAIGLDMADEIGGLGAAIAAAADEAGYHPGTYEVIDYPEPPSLSEVFEEAFGVRARAGVSPAGGVSQLLPGLGRSVMGERAWSQVGASLDAMLLLRESPVVLTTPRVIVVEP